ncbi:UDP-N-acetylglucosamine 2-epimerase [Candidatus Desulforudis audaxviator MP104C]|uniref:UDP-N-acetylglucosamine 2-epimerase (non-hydrolyzing) n=1 Tax=Desulforudis audaxviator (strain MP104C) TaxID=477974 RepID=B1I6M3_DESAP|nr:UDP-N-acetylglucosamine 2-epimerase [Candidatus Desulforudis audaxviator MP104C]
MGPGKSQKVKRGLAPFSRRWRAVKDRKVLVVFGTRPEAIKMAPVVKELERSPWFEPRVVVTAQHREMLDQVLDLFGIVPAHDLDIMRPGQSLFDVTGRALRGLEEVFSRESPDFVLVHGDTTTTFVGALAAYYLQIPVGHVEAGLRTRNKFSPFPEELNRHLTGVLADLHFAPTARARANLLAENVSPERIAVTGNTVIDALLETVRRDYDFISLVETASPAATPAGRKGLARLAALAAREPRFAPYRLLLVTTHRRENLGAPLRGVYRALRRILQEFPDTLVVFPVHLNPAVQDAAAELGGTERVLRTPPLSYLPFVKLMEAAHLVLTDSGGLQEEAPALGKPVLVLRDTTERPEAVEAGTVKLVGLDEENVWRETARLLSDSDAYRQMAEAVNPYGDGEAARRTVGFLAAYFGLAAPPDEYVKIF